MHNSSPVVRVVPWWSAVVVLLVFVLTVLTFVGVFPPLSGVPLLVVPALAIAAVLAVTR